jgi:mRNA-degrading endonuclease toxin of MazEF toxin-antitoxin module
VIVLETAGLLVLVVCRTRKKGLHFSVLLPCTTV